MNVILKVYANRVELWQDETKVETFRTVPIAEQYLELAQVKEYRIEYYDSFGGLVHVHQQRGK